MFFVCDSVWICVRGGLFHGCGCLGFVRRLAEWGSFLVQWCVFLDFYINGCVHAGRFFRSE